MILKKETADDILKYVSLLDGEDTKTIFVARNLRKVPQIDPGSANQCFLMEIVKDLHKR